LCSTTSATSKHQCTNQVLNRPDISTSNPNLNQGLVDVNSILNSTDEDKRWKGKYEVIDASVNVNKSTHRHEMKHSQKIICLLAKTNVGIDINIAQSRIIFRAKLSNGYLANNIGNEMRPLYVDPDKMDITNIKWRLNFALHENEYRYHMIVTNDLSRNIPRKE
jgi:hypothetical protein